MLCWVFSAIVHFAAALCETLLFCKAAVGTFQRCILLSSVALQIAIRVVCASKFGKSALRALVYEYVFAFPTPVPEFVSLRVRLRVKKVRTSAQKLRYRKRSLFVGLLGVISITPLSW